MNTVHAKNARLDVAKAVKLRIQNGLSYDEIAKTLGMPKSTVYENVSKVLGCLTIPSVTHYSGTMQGRYCVV